MPADTDNQLLQQALVAAGGIPRPGDTTNSLLRKLVYALGAVMAGGGGSGGLSAGVPTADQGSDGDYFLDLSTGNYYLKTGGTWVLQGQVTQGPQGPAGAPGTPGALWYFGTGDPDPGMGIDNDVYLEDNGDVWVKSGGSWFHAAINLTGPQGTQGIQGIQGPAGTFSHSTLNYAASTEIDFTSDDYRTLTLAGDVEFTTANRAAALSVSVRIIAGASPRTFTFPAGWTFLGVGAPASIAANKTAILTVTCFGANDTDIVAAYAVQP